LLCKQIFTEHKVTEMIVSLLFPTNKTTIAQSKLSEFLLLATSEELLTDDKIQLLHLALYQHDAKRVHQTDFK